VSEPRLRTRRLALVSALVRLLPETRCFELKRALYNWAGAVLDKNVRVCSSVVILGNGSLIIGSGTWVGHEAMIVTGSRVEIGSDADIAPRVYIGTGTHETGSHGKAAGRGLHRDVSIGDGAWIGACALILPGVTVGPGCAVGAGAVVTRSVTSGTKVAGNPAREIFPSVPSPQGEGSPLNPML
jgi:acetyltransferase-like isoleucine patch superfamily enzyme